MVITHKKNTNEMTVAAAKDGTQGQQLLWLLLLATVYLLRDIVRLPIPGIVFTGICGIAFLFLSTGSAMGVYIFTSALTVADYEIRLVYLAVLFVKYWRRQQKMEGSLLVVIMVMALLELVDLTLFSKENMIGVIYTTVMRLSYFALPMFWFSEDFSSEDYRRALFCYVAGVLLGGSVLLYMSVQDVGWRILLEGTAVRLGLNTADDYITTSTMRTSYNANQLGIMFALVIAIMISLMESKHISKLRGVLITALSAFMILLTKSRTAVLLLGVIAVCVYFVSAFRREKRLSGTFFFVMFVVISSWECINTCCFSGYIVLNFRNECRQESCGNSKSCSIIQSA